MSDYIYDIKFNGISRKMVHFYYGYGKDLFYQFDERGRYLNENGVITLNGVDYTPLEAFEFLKYNSDSYFNICSKNEGDKQYVQTVIPSPIDLEFRKCISVGYSKNWRSSDCRRIYCKDVCDIFVMYDEVFPDFKLINEFQDMHNAKAIAFIIDPDNVWIAEVTDFDLYKKLLAKNRFIRRQ